MEYNDYELVSMAKEGNEEAINLLYQKYKPIIVRKSNDSIFRVSHHGIEITDIMQEGFIGLDEAINSFTENDNSSFYTFALLCIDRQIINYIRKITRGKNMILNDAVTIDDNIEKFIKADFDTELSVFTKEQELNIIDKAKVSLTCFEYQVFLLKYDGYSCEEIANILKKDIKSIYNTFNRIKTKIRKLLEEDN